MSDPSVLILQGCFATALMLFLAAVIFRGKAGRRDDVADWRGSPDAVEPYEASGSEVAATPPPLPTKGISTSIYRPLDGLWMASIFGIFYLLSIMTAQQSGSGEVRIDASVLVGSMIFQGILTVITLGVIWPRVSPVTWLGLRWKKWPLVFALAPASVIGMLVVFGSLQAAGYMEWMQSLGGDSIQDGVKLLQTSTDPMTLGLMALAAVGVAPICEELVFRGYLYPAAKRFVGPWVAGISTSLVFAAAHGNLMALFPLALFGGVLVVLYEKTGSLWAPVAAHFCFNGFTVVAQIAVRYYDIPVEAP